MARRRGTVARHGRLRSPSVGGQLLKLLAVAATVVLVAVAGTAAFTAYNLASDFGEFAEGAVALDDDLVVPPDIGEIEGGVSLFLTGIDQCEDEYRQLFGDRCKGPDSESNLNDVNILLHISDAPRRVTVVSFPRDMVFQAPGCERTGGGQWSGGTVKINELYGIGGLACATKAISEMSELAIPFAATVTFGGVIEVTNAVGGVEVCLENPIRDRNTNLDLAAGNHTVQGIEALQFLRTRYGVGGSDLARVSNQQQYMSRLARKLVSEQVLSDPTTLYRLATSALESVTPNDRLTNPLTIVQIAMAVRDVPFDQIAFVQYPTVPDPNDPNVSVVPNYDAAEPLWTALAENRPIEITGGVAVNGGTVEVKPEDGSGTATPEAPTGGPEPDPSATSNAIALPPSITGSTAEQQTCSRGNVGLG